MKSIFLKNSRNIIFALLAMSVGFAQAHTGHSVHGFVDGLSHPFGLDHLLAIVAVGIWSSTVLHQNQVWQGPAVFMASLVLSAMMGAIGIQVPFLENAIAFSVVLFGFMLVLAQQKMSKKLGLIVIALAASLHGLAHGSEAPATDFASYAVGFLSTTGALHLVGIMSVLGMRKFMSQQAASVTSVLGVIFSVVGLYMFNQL